MMSTKLYSNPNNAAASADMGAGLLNRDYLIGTTEQRVLDRKYRH